MKTLTIWTLISVIFTSLSIDYYFITKMQKTEQQANELFKQREHSKFATEMNQIISDKSYPVVFNEVAKITSVRIYDNTLAYYLLFEKGEAPGKRNGMSYKESSSIVENMIKVNFCNKSYFQKLPIAIQFHILTNGMKNTIDNTPVISMISSEVCYNANS